MAGLMYRFGINDAAKTKIEIIALGACVSWTVNFLRQGMKLSIVIFGGEGKGWKRSCELRSYFKTYQVARITCDP